MDKNSRIYVAGHKGLVGTALTKLLNEKHYKNLIRKTSAELDLRNQQKTEEFFKKERPDYVFLAAAKVGGILANDTYKAEFLYENMMIAANVIHAAYKHGVKKLLNLGSSCIYPKFASQPLKEEYLLSGSLEPTNEPYAIAKIAGVKLCRYYNEQYGTDFLSVMPNNLYGPNDNYNLETGHAMGMLVRKFYLAKLLQKKNFEGLKRDVNRYPLGFGIDEKIHRDDEKAIIAALRELGVTDSCVTLWGTGMPLREFLYIDDLVDACIFLIEKYSYKDIGEIINVGSGEEVTLHDLAQSIREITGFSGKISWDGSRPDGTPRKCIDTSKMKNLGWQSKVTLKIGIQKAYDWYVKNL
ncbi:GDP-L-fucose synthase family protein [Candidatus Omnitrophota bacterium]